MVGTRCSLGLKPTTPQSAAGTRGAAGVGTERDHAHVVGGPPPPRPKMSRPARAPDRQEFPGVP